MKLIPAGHIATTVEAFLREDSRVAASRRRERSWDFCFNHFQDHDNPTEVMDLSCLHLGYYLASWGMLRGSSFLLTTNAMHYQHAIEAIEAHNPTMRGFDVHDYRDPTRRRALEAAWADLSTALLPAGGRAITLVSKTMIGVWGCVPAFDSYFRTTFKSLADTPKERGAFDRVGEAALGHLADVYNQHAGEIDQLCREHTAWDMATGSPTGRRMTRAKILDVYGFQAAFDS